MVPVTIVALVRKEEAVSASSLVSVHGSVGERLINVVVLTLVITVLELVVVEFVDGFGTAIRNHDLTSFSHFGVYLNNYKRTSI